ARQHPPQNGQPLLAQVPPLVLLAPVLAAPREQDRPLLALGGGHRHALLASYEQRSAAAIGEDAGHGARSRMPPVIVECSTFRARLRSTATPTARPRRNSAAQV